MSISPTDGVLDAGQEVVPTIVFSADVDPASITAASVELQGRQGVVPTKLEVAGKQVIVTPLEKLTLASAYTVALATSIKDSAGRPLPAPTKSTFTVADGQWRAAVDIGTGASGVPSEARLASNRSGDAFVLWRSTNGAKRTLWANRYVAKTNSWGVAVALYEDGIIETAPPPYSRDSDLNIAVDGKGNALAVWQTGKFPDRSIPASAFDASTATWDAAPTVLASTDSFTSPYEPTLSMDASGNAWAAWATTRLIHGRYFDVVSRRWLADETIEENNIGNGFSSRPAVAFDTAGNAVAAFSNGRNSASIISSNAFTRATKEWDRLPPGGPSSLGGVEGSLMLLTGPRRLKFVVDPRDGFLVAWDINNGSSGTKTAIRLARRVSKSLDWTPAETVVDANPEHDLHLQSVRVDRSGRPLLVWTQTDNARTALKSIQEKTARDGFSLPTTIDASVGGAAAAGDFDLDRSGNGVMVWLRGDASTPEQSKRFDLATARYRAAGEAWNTASLIDASAGTVRSPSLAVRADGRALLASIEEDAGVYRVKVRRFE